MQAELSTTSQETNDEESTEIEQKPYMLLPYAGDNDENVMRRLKKKLPEKLRPRIVYNGTKKSYFFPVKDKINTLHCSNVVYYYKSSNDHHKDEYIGETKCRLGKRVNEHQGSDKESAIEKKIDPPTADEFSILVRNYKNRKKRKIAESLFVKDKKSNLNIQRDIQTSAFQIDGIRHLCHCTVENTTLTIKTFVKV